MDVLDPFDVLHIPLGVWVENGLLWLVDNYRFVFQAIKQPFHFILFSLQAGLNKVPPLIIIFIGGMLGWQIAGWRVGWGVVLCLFLIGLLGAWTEAMVTLSIVLTAVVFCVSIGIPLGLVAARSNRFWVTIRPVLDLMQTIPSFCYLIPIVMLFGIGNVPGVIVTVVHALPPVIRLTNLGIRQVRDDLVEAAHAFGASSRQSLFKIEIPLAMPTIMAGVNQTIMMVLSMVVVASMIAVTGLGQMVLRGIGRLDMGLATVGGLSIVLLAIVLDRISQGFGLTMRDRGHRRWYETGPVGIVWLRFRPLWIPPESTQ